MLLENINHELNFSKIQKTIDYLGSEGGEYEIQINPNFGESEWRFKMDEDCFQTYDYNNQQYSGLVLQLQRLGNIGEEFDVLYKVIDKEDGAESGLVISNLNGECFDSYVFSHMELDENTWFCRVK